MARKSIQVKPKSDGWAVVHSSTKQQVGVYRTKAEATKTAQKIAKDQNLDLVIQAGVSRYGTARGVNTNVVRSEVRGVNPVIKSSLSMKPAPKSEKQESEAQKKARLWREWAGSHQGGSPNLSDDAISRESIYGDRG